MSENVKPLDIDLSLKKNNVDEFFFNLSENPNGFKNKDFRYTLSLIYQLVEDEFEGIFLSPNSPVRNTDFFLINEGNGSASAAFELIESARQGVLEQFGITLETEVRIVP